jgi:uncharacterized membrane protein (UPF0127 family)
MKKRSRPKKSSKKTATALLFVAAFSVCAAVAMLYLFAASHPNTPEPSAGSPTPRSVRPSPPSASATHQAIAWPRADVRIGDCELHVEIADTPQRRATGLSGRSALPADQGMLFVFAYPQRLDFWMKDTAIPLSIAFISSEGIIEQIEHMTPFDLHTVTSHTPVQYALVVNQGFFEKNGITAGSRVDITGAIAVLKGQ